MSKVPRGVFLIVFGARELRIMNLNSWSKHMLYKCESIPTGFFMTIKLHDTLSLRGWGNGPKYHLENYLFKKGVCLFLSDTYSTLDTKPHPFVSRLIWNFQSFILYLLCCIEIINQVYWRKFMGGTAIICIIVVFLTLLLLYYHRGS